MFGLGLTGWLILYRLRFPAPEILGPIVLIGALRTLRIELPPAPEMLFPIAQIIIGIFVGSMLDKNSARQLKTMGVSALIVIAWTFSMLIIIGFFLNRYSDMDPTTALLSASMGGLPEISILVVASGASSAIVIFMHMFRMIGSVMLFPIILERIEARNQIKNPARKKEPPDSENLPRLNNDSGPTFGASKSKHGSKDNVWQVSQFFNDYRAKICRNLNHSNLQQLWSLTRQSWPRVLFTVAVAAAGGFILHSFGVPAGLMVGSTFSVAAVSVAGVPVSRVPKRLLGILLVTIGINLADHITPEMISTMANLKFLIPVLIATGAMFVSSFGVAWLIFRLTDWDFPTSFLAAAPAGFTLMTSLAIKHDLDPFKVSMLHLCRLLSIKLFVPIIIMSMM